MKFKYALKSSIQALKTNKTRSALTMLGIIIGICAIIVILSLGNSAKGLILSQIEGMGTKTFAIEPGRKPEGASDFSSYLLDSLKKDDLEALLNKQKVPGILDLTPDILVPGGVAFESETYTGLTLGVGPALADIFDIYPDMGRFLTDDDVNQNARVAVIGDKVKDELFGDSEALGKKIKIKETSFQIIGVFKKIGSIAFFDVDNSILIPHSSAQKYLTGTDHFNEILVRAKTQEGLARTVEDVKITLRESHNIDDPEKDDFHIQTQEDLADTVSIVTDVISILLSLVAAISLFVGGIGIMNIMYVSIKERTREIGLRKALGATQENIRNQFIYEALILTIIGGIIGIISGLIVAAIASYIIEWIADIDWKLQISGMSIILGVSVSTIVGLVFGYFPAKNAAQKDPIESLRYE